MKAYQLDRYDGPGALRLTEVADPKRVPDRVLLEVRAIGINYPDLLMTRGEYQLRPDLPCVPGCEVAGVVLESPDNSAWATGDRVAAFVWQGGFAEKVSVAPEGMASISDDVDFGTAAAMVVNFHTVHFALARRAAVLPGENVLVLGAAGGIGGAAVQVARGLGARVIAGVTGPSQLAAAEAAGADDVVILEPGFSDIIRRDILKAGVDVIVDPVGDWVSHEALRCLAPEGRLLVLGFAGGAIPTVKFNRLLLKNISIIGVAFGAFLPSEPRLMQDQAKSLDVMREAGLINPIIGLRGNFDDVPQALEALGRGQIQGKGIIEIATQSGQ